MGKATRAKVEEKENIARTKNEDANNNEINILTETDCGREKDDRGTNQVEPERKEANLDQEHGESTKIGEDAVSKENRDHEEAVSVTEVCSKEEDSIEKNNIEDNKEGNQCSKKDKAESEICKDVNESSEVE